MNRVAHRTTIALLLVLVLLGGMAMFCVEYVTKGSDWVVFEGNPHLYNGGNIGTGVITDRDGTMLLSAMDEWTYSDDPMIRQSTIHWLGDRDGYISAPTVAYYAEEMAGYNLVNGLYAYSDGGGKAQMTLSAQLQKAALEAMGDYRGTVAVYNYETGEILCAVSTPNYDPDDVPDIDEDDSGAYEGVYLNRFTQVTYVPGSIFKVVTAAAALERLNDARDITFECNGTYEMGADEIVCMRTHGSVDLEDALAVSCNCYFAQLSELLGADSLQEYVDQFRIIQPLDFDGITTAQGKFQIENAAPVETAWSAIGQHLDLVNPARFMTFMGVIAGGGKAAEPYVISQVSSGGHVKYRAKTTMTDRLMSEETAEELAELMRNNVTQIYGDGYFPGMSVCAKSGTAEVGGGKDPNATFAGFVTDEEYPLAFIAVVENGGSGSGTCVPIVSDVLIACRDYLDSMA